MFDLTKSYIVTDPACAYRGCTVQIKYASGPVCLVTHKTDTAEISFSVRQSDLQPVS